MSKIISKIDGSDICCYIKSHEVGEYRTDMSNTSEILQTSARLLERGTHIKAHRHLPTKKEIVGTQEAWIVIRGEILATIYDLDNSELAKITVSSGDMIVFYRGGHELLAISEETIFYELKTGPYLGYENDKEQLY